MILSDLDNIVYNKFANGEITLAEYIKYQNRDKIMNYEQKHPILQKLEEYFKNTPKEQIDKDWSDILNDTDSEAYFEKKYNDALERAKECLKDDSIIAKAYVESIFPELTMSEDEKMKDYIKDVIQAAIIPKKENKQKMIAWLEKQGEKKNTRKREIDDAYLQGICDAKHEIEKQGEQLDPDKVIEWLVANICDFEYYVKRFKQDFGL